MLMPEVTEASNFKGNIDVSQIRVTGFTPRASVSSCQMSQRLLCYPIDQSDFGCKVSKDIDLES
jgi:hypothetical protein